MQTKSKIAVVGDKESILGFRAVGFQTFEAATPAEDRTLIDRLAKNDFGIIFITEQTLVRIEDVLEKYKNAKIPAIIPIPSKDGMLGLGMKNVKSSVERAVGADILFKD